jgi:hypothetical protein
MHSRGASIACKRWALRGVACLPGLAAWVVNDGATAMALQFFLSTLFPWDEGFHYFKVPSGLDLLSI